MFPYKQTRSDCRPLSASLANASVFLTIFSLFFFSRHGASFFAFASLVGSVTASFNTEFELQQVWTLGLFPLLFVVSCLALFCLPSSGLICQLSYHLVSPDHRADVSSGLICQPSYHLVSPDHRADVSSGLICHLPITLSRVITVPTSRLVSSYLCAVLRPRCTIRLSHTIRSGATGTQWSGSVYGSGASHSTTASSKPSFRAPWRVDDVVVGRGNAGWTTSKLSLIHI